MNYESKAKLVTNRIGIGDVHYSLPILLDEHHNVLDVAEAIFRIFSGSNYNSASKNKKLEGVSKGSHFQLIDCAPRA